MSNPNSNIKREIPSNSLSNSHKTLPSNKSFTSSRSHLQELPSKPSREQEKATILAMENKDCNVNYLIEASWIKDWALYISGSEPPGKMRTKKLLNSKEKLKKKLSFKKDYRVLNKDQWYFLKSIHGADPSVKKKNKQRYSESKKIEQEENNQDDSQSTPKNCALNLRLPSNIRSSSTADNSFIAPKPSHVRTLSEITIPKKQTIVTEIANLKPPPASAELKSGKDTLESYTRSTMHSTPQESNSDFALISPSDYLKKGLVGLDNPKNYCYMNAGVQLLLSIVPLRDFFYKQKLDGNDYPFTQSFINVTTSVFKLNHGSTSQIFWPFYI
ncbi:unnamed protein product [Blepharisma stoltei]|uniref:DUSP domain-containing protein n=1 Tax=Blepharisma stoltei TaxID=1481888 RepID=A0AAU9JSR3_9CILI|nr:unnamed protein product [Blepharisma stoltei]